MFWEIRRLRPNTVLASIPAPNLVLQREPQPGALLSVAGQERGFAAGDPTRTKAIARASHNLWSVLRLMERTTHTSSWGSNSADT
jgi:hypothetical protein